MRSDETQADLVQMINLKLVDPYNITKAGTFELGQYFGLKNMPKIKGLRIADGVQLSAAGQPEGNAVLMTSAQLKKICITLYNQDAGGATVVNLPLTALCIDGANEIKAGPFYQINFPVDWSKSSLTICDAVALPVSGYYLLSIQVYF